PPPPRRPPPLAPRPPDRPPFPAKAAQRPLGTERLRRPPPQQRRQLGEGEIRLLAELAEDAHPEGRVAPRRLGPPPLREQDGEEVAVDVGVERLQLGEAAELDRRRL